VGVEELLAALIALVGRAAVQSVLEHLVGRAHAEQPLSGRGCERLSPARFDADELGIYDDDEEYECHD